MSEDQVLNEEEILDEHEEHEETPDPIVEEAKLQGWVPKEQFRGNEDDWVDAETFVRRGKEINPILKKNNERLLKEIESTKKQMEELRSATEQFKKFQKEQHERKVTELEIELRNLREQKKEAISQGDGERAVALDERIEELREEKSKAQISTTEVIDEKPTEVIRPEVEAWVSKNQWYAQNQAMQQATNAIAEQIRKSQPWLVGDAFFDELDKMLEDTFSLEKLGRAPKTKVRTPVERPAPGNGYSRVTGGKHRYEDLPPEAKQACDTFVRQKLMSREEYVESYFA